MLAGAVAKHFGLVIIAVRQDRQRRDAAAAGEEQLGRFATRRSKNYRLYLHFYKLILPAKCLRRF
jgi:hypothetical protein